MGSRDREKSQTDLLRRGLGAGHQGLAESAEDCPEPEILAAYSENSLDSQETARWELHFSQCSRCREQLAMIVRASESAAPAEHPRTSHWAWLIDWRWLAPVAAALIVAAIWSARRPAQKLPEQHPLVAMSSQQPKPPAPAVKEFARNESVPAPAAVPPVKTLPNLTRDLAPAEKQSRERAPSRVATDEKALASNADSAAPADSLAKKDSQSQADSGIAAGIPAGSAKAPLSPAAPSPATANGIMQSRQTSQSVTVESQVGTLEPQPGAVQTVANDSPASERVSRQAQDSSRPRQQNLGAAMIAPASRRTVIATPDPKVLWRIEDSTEVGLSKDGGATWQKQQLPSFQPNPQITAGYAPSAKICWLVGRGGTILLTRDAAHWMPIPPPMDADFRRVKAQDNFSATVTTTDGRKFSTDDAGDHWVAVH